MKKRLLILYTEYAAYLDACLRKFADLYGYQVHVVRYPLDKNAPFALKDSSNIFFYNRNDLDLNGLWQLYKEVDPDAILVSGWIDGLYNRLARKFKSDGKMVVAVVDNLWTDSLKQKLFSLFADTFFKPRFTHFWIPGMAQYEYLRKMGVDADKIMVGYYSADSDLFISKYAAATPFRRRFMYVGRLLDIKGTPTLLEAIELINLNKQADWDFLIIGNGTYEQNVKDLARKYSNITYKPFLQPAELAEQTSQGGVFILPSNYDAWGVVVHEFALMGSPLILSTMVGSRNYFVTPGYNGYHFTAGNSQSLLHAMNVMMQLSDAELKEMSARSHLIGKTITTEAWAARLRQTIASHYIQN